MIEITKLRCGSTTRRSGDGNVSKAIKPISNEQHCHCHQQEMRDEVKIIEHSPSATHDPPNKRKHHNALVEIAHGVDSCISPYSTGSTLLIG